MAVFHSFLWLSSIPLCIYIFIHSSVYRHIDCFHVLAIVNSAAVNTGVHVSFQIIVLSGYMPRKIGGETVRDFIFWGSKSLQMVTAAMKLKNACSLEGKL